MWSKKPKQYLSSGLNTCVIGVPAMGQTSGVTTPKKVVRVLVNDDGTLNVNDPTASAAIIAALSTIDTDILAFKSANHTDLVQLDTDLQTISSQLNTIISLLGGTINVAVVSPLSGSGFVETHNNP